MSLRTLLSLVLAIICAGSAAVGILLVRNSRGKTTDETAQVVVAKSEIARGQLVTEAMVTMRPWPTEIVPLRAMRDLPSVVGRTALTQITAGEPVLESKLADRNAGRGLASLIPDGRRAYTIQTSRVASNVAGFVLPGNRVDVLLTLRGGPNDATGGGSSTTLLQAVEILAVDQQLDAPVEKQVAPQHLRSVTLLVTPDQASLLDLGQNMGTLTLSLRNPEDIAEADTVPATVNVLRYTQRQPVGDETASSEAQGSWINQSMAWLAATAVSLQKAAALSAVSAGGTDGRDTRNQFVEIQTLRGRYPGRILVRSRR